MKNYGLDEVLQGIEDYVTGQNKMPWIEYNPSGSWRKWLPRYEAQADEFESYGCTEWGLQNQIETFYKFLYGTEPNYDEWFNYPLIPITPNGQDPHITYESARKTGFVPAGTTRVPESMTEALDSRRITGSMLAKGLNWLEVHDFRHEWVWGARPLNYKELLKEALKTSVLGVSVHAWNEVNGEYVSEGTRNNHWCILFEIDEEGYLWIFDTYDHSIKKLSKDHYIGRAKRIWINKRTRSGARRHIRVLESILKALKLMNKTLLDVCRENLGKDASPKDTAPDELACVDSVTTILKQVRPETPHMVSTIAFNAYLANPAGKYVRVDIPEPEDIIISPTNGKKIGHVGICMEDGLIASNNSFGQNSGKFTQNYTLPVWNKYYKDKLGLQVYIYRKV